MVFDVENPLGHVHVPWNHANMAAISTCMGSCIWLQLFGVQVT